MSKAYDRKAASLELVHNAAKLLCAEGYLDFTTCQSLDHALYIVSDKHKLFLAFELLNNIDTSDHSNQSLIEIEQIKEQLEGVANNVYR